MDGTLSWHEAWSLVERLALDPSSHLCASINGWRHPLSRDAMTLADLYDVTVAAHVDKRKRRSIKPYPRPWKRGAAGRRSKAPVVDQATVRALLDARRPRSAEESTSDDQEEVTHGR